MWLSITLIFEKKKRGNLSLFTSYVFLLIINFTFRKQHFVVKRCHILLRDVDTTGEASATQHTKVEGLQDKAEEKEIPRQETELGEQGSR